MYQVTTTLRVEHGIITRTACFEHKEDAQNAADRLKYWDAKVMIGVQVEYRPIFSSRLRSKDLQKILLGMRFD